MRRARISVCLWALLQVLPPTLAAAQDHAGHQHGAPSRCLDGALSCATAATPSFGRDGKVWLAWSAAGRVWVASSRDGGASTSVPVPVSGDPAAIDDNGEARPLVIELKDGSLLASWTVRRDAAFNGMVLLARSTDGGQSFTPPYPLTGSETSPSQRFPRLVETKDGSVLALWIDKRRMAAAKAAGREYAGAALAVAWSSDGGASFAPTRIAMDSSCECCRLAIAFDRARTPWFAWRQIYDGQVRDHAIARLGPDGALKAPTRVSLDDWRIDACPHHGPALAIDPTGVRHVAWYTEGSQRQGLFYARQAKGKSFSAPLPFGNRAQAAQHPQLAAVAGTLWLLWKEFDGTLSQARAMHSSDGGESWSAPQGIASTADASDQPLLVSDGQRAFLSWSTRAEGYRLIPLKAER